MFYKKQMSIDTTKGPIMVSKLGFDSKPLLKVVSIILGIVLWITAFCWIASATAPKIEVHCASGGSLVFRSIEDGEYIAYVSHASEEQVEAIKRLNIKVDSSVDNDFIRCISEIHYYEIRLDGERVLVYGPDVTPPSNYNHPLSEEERNDMLEASSDEVKYLYEELNDIFKV